MATDRNPKTAPLPFLFINMSMTADGKIATTNRVVSTFTSRRDHAHLLELRSTADAVMCGARTVDLNDVNLGPGAPKYRRLRLRRGLAENNLRIIVTGSGSLDTSASIFQKRFSPIIILTTNRVSARQLKQLQTVADEVKLCGDTEIDFPAALRWLRGKWGIKRLLCEGGGELNGALFHAGLVDELHLTLSPKIIGGRDAPTIADGEGIPSLAEAARLQLKSAKQIANELFLVYTRKSSHASTHPPLVPTFRFEP
jgi:riboflavin-specific deaminase-like protein